MTKSISILLFFWSAITLGQEGEIIYKTYTTETHNKDTEYAKRLASEIDQMKYSLRYTADASIFTLLPYVTEDDMISKLAQISTNALFDIYQSPKERVSFYEQAIKGKKYTVINSSTMTDWNLENETKIIDGFKAYKATLNMFNDRTSKYTIVEAWYTPEISLPYGPAGFGGLPGLILELRKSSIIYVVEKVTMNPNNGVKKFEVPEIVNPVSEVEIVKLMRASRKVTPD